MVAASTKAAGRSWAMAADAYADARSANSEWRMANGKIAMPIRFRWFDLIVLPNSLFAIRYSPSTPARR
jgi:hypothetical protein